MTSACVLPARASAWALYPAEMSIVSRRKSSRRLLRCLPNTGPASESRHRACSLRAGRRASTVLPQLRSTTHALDDFIPAQILIITEQTSPHGAPPPHPLPLSPLPKSETWRGDTGRHALVIVVPACAALCRSSWGLMCMAGEPEQGHEAGRSLDPRPCLLQPSLQTPPHARLKLCSAVESKHRHRRHLMRLPTASNYHLP